MTRALVIANMAGKSNLDGIQRLVAAQLADAKEQALSGCEDARRWIRECAAAHLHVLTGDAERADALALILGRLVDGEEVDEDDETADIDMEHLFYTQAALFAAD